MLSIALDVSFGKSEVQNKNFVARLVQSDAEIVGLNITMDKVAVVDVLDPLDHLVDEHQHCFQGKLSQSLIEQ